MAPPSAVDRFTGQLEAVSTQLGFLHDALAAVTRVGPADPGVEAALAAAQVACDETGWDLPAGLRALLEADAELTPRYSGAVEEIVLNVAAARARLPAPAGPVAERVVAAAATQAALAPACRRARGLLAPILVARELADLQPGDRIDLATLFGEPLDPAALQAIVAGLKHEPPGRCGVVDSAQQVVYRTADEPAWRAWMLASLPLALLGGVGFLFVLGHLDEWFSLDIPQLNSTRRLLAVYALSAFGAFLHLFVAAQKSRKQDSTTTKIVEAAYWQWLPLRVMSLCRLVVPILVTTVVVRFTNLHVDGTEDWAVAILAGYSSDSIAAMAWDALDESVQTFAAKTQRS